MLTVESTIYNNYPVFIFVNDSNLTNNDVQLFFDNMENNILKHDSSFYIAFYTSKMDELSTIAIINKFKFKIKQLSDTLKNKCLAIFIHCEDNTINKIIKFIESFIKTSFPIKVVKNTEDGYNFLSLYS